MVILQHIRSLLFILHIFLVQIKLLINILGAIQSIKLPLFEVTSAYSVMVSVFNVITANVVKHLNINNRNGMVSIGQALWILFKWIYIKRDEHCMYNVR